MIFRVFLIFFSFLIPPSLVADVVIAARNIRPGDVLGEMDVMVIRGATEGAFEKAAPIVGSEAIVALYAGRAILRTQIAPAPLVKRNQIIEISFLSGGLSMTTEGRALARGAEGERIRVMNLSSKSPIFGIVQSDGTVRVSP